MFCLNGSTVTLQMNDCASIRPPLYRVCHDCSSIKCTYTHYTLHIRYLLMKSEVDRFQTKTLISCLCALRYNTIKCLHVNYMIANTCTVSFLVLTIYCET